MKQSVFNSLLALHFNYQEIRMNKLLVLSCVLFSFLVPSLQAKELKIGVLDFARVMEESPQAEKARESIMGEFAPREKELRKLGESIRSKEERFARDGAIMSASEREKLERDVVSEKREFKRKQDLFREDVSIKQNELIGTLQRKLIGSIKKYAEANGYDLLLAEGVVYATDSVNVTKDVLAHLRKDTK